MRQYKQLVQEVMKKGSNRGDRTNTGTRSIFGHQMRFDLKEGFPLVTGKKTVLRSIVHELLWFLQGSTNIQYLHDNNVHIWDEWADINGNLGPVYGKQWRSWPDYKEAIYLGGDSGPGGLDRHYYEESIDQISNVIAQVKLNPMSRRLIVSAWNPSEVDFMALPPCHVLFQFYCTELTYEERVAHYLGMPPVDTSDSQAALSQAVLDSADVPKYKISCQLYQRSADVFLGVPFNIASYALLTMMVAKICNMVPDEFIWTGGDCHLYSNHFTQVEEYLESETHDLPEMIIHGDQKGIDDFKFEDFELKNYKCGPLIRAPIAV